MNKVIERIKNVLKDTKTKALDDYLNVDEGIVNSWKRGEYIPSTQNLIKLSNYYSLSIDYFLNKTNVFEEREFKKVISFDDSLKKYMDLKHKTQYKMVIKDKICSSSCFHKWNKKKTFPSVEMLKKLSDYLNITIDELLVRE